MDSKPDASLSFSPRSREMATEAWAISAADLPAAFDAYRPLLAHPKEHVRDFAAESFAYLLR